jgi:hypothetical protein
VEADGAADGERISLDVLPPAIAPAMASGPEGVDVVVKPRRRTTRRPRPEEGEEIAPAA